MWDRKRYRNYCVELFERANGRTYRALLGLDLLALAEQELERDRVLRTYLEKKFDGERAASRLSKDIRMYGQVASLAAAL